MKGVSAQPPDEGALFSRPDLALTRQVGNLNLEDDAIKGV
jgi:hypothetical protein